MTTIRDEIAGLIGRVENRKRECDDAVGAIEVMDDLAEALRALAQENKAERVAIRRKTIEECADAALAAMRQKGWENEDVWEAIRALAHSKTGEE